MITKREMIAKLTMGMMLAHMGYASAVTWEISGTITAPTNGDALEALHDLKGTSFTSYLSYNETASPTSVLSPEFVNYANEGSITFAAIAGSARADLQNLQTFIKETPEGRGSNFNGASFNVELGGSASFLSLVPTSIDFQFLQTSPANAGLTDFSLPGHLSIADFDAGFVRLTFASDSEQFPTISILGQITDVSLIPEPETYAMFLGGLLLLGWQTRRSTLCSAQALDGHLMHKVHG